MIRGVAATSLYLIKWQQWMMDDDYDSDGDDNDNDDDDDDGDAYCIDLVTTSVPGVSIISPC